MIARPQVTAEEFMRLPDNGRKRELVDGEVVEVATSEEHSDIAVTLLSLLLAAGGRKLGRVFDADLGCRMDSGNYRCPDASFIRWERLPEDRSRTGFLEGAPDLCFEIISPSERPDDMFRRVGEYFTSGAQQVWHLFPETRTVVIYRSMDNVRTYGPEDIVEAGELLPNFRHRVTDLFSVE